MSLAALLCLKCEAQESWGAAWIKRIKKIIKRVPLHQEGGEAQMFCV